MDFPLIPRVIKRGVRRDGVAYSVVEDRYGVPHTFCCYEALRQRETGDIPGRAKKADGNRVANGGYRRRLRRL